MEGDPALKIEKRTDWINQQEKIQSLEIGDNKAIHYYSYTYLVDEQGLFRPLVRWDNFNNNPHVDVFENDAFKRYATDSKEYSEVQKIVRLFRMNLPRMDLRNL
jgi:hypothetical protein